MIDTELIPPLGIRFYLTEKNKKCNTDGTCHGSGKDWRNLFPWSNLDDPHIGVSSYSQTSNSSLSARVPRDFYIVSHITCMKVNLVSWAHEVVFCSFLAGICMYIFVCKIKVNTTYNLIYIILNSYSFKFLTKESLKQGLKFRRWAGGRE